MSRLRARRSGYAEDQPRPATSSFHARTRAHQTVMKEAEIAASATVGHAHGKRMGPARTRRIGEALPCKHGVAVL